MYKGYTYIKYKYDWHDDGNEYFTYLEILNECALRQVLKLKYEYIGSNREDDKFEFFLTEGNLILEKLDYYEIITKEEFEQEWKSHCSKYIKDWKLAKIKYKNNLDIEGTIRVIYPQGVIIQIDNNTLGIINYEELKNKIGSNKIYPMVKIKTKVIGYDEDNMWLILK